MKTKTIVRKPLMIKIKISSTFQETALRSADIKDVTSQGSFGLKLMLFF